MKNKDVPDWVYKQLSENFKDILDDDMKENGPQFIGKDLVDFDIDTSH